MVELELGMVAFAAAFAIGISAYSAAKAETEIGTAALGALAENEKLFVPSLILMVIPETIVIFGLVTSILIIGLAG